ncbi:MAG: aliphatic sulfonate ABC transporter permease SsuC [Waterburya sp.]
MSKQLQAPKLDTVIPWVVPIALLVIWQFSIQWGWLSNRILPAPTDVIKAAFQLVITGELWSSLIISTTRALIGFLIGGSLGLILGFLNGIFRPAEAILDTSVQMLRNIPHLAMIPLVILWFGIGETAKIFLVSIGVLFPIYINTFYGIRGVDVGLIEMGKVYGLSFWQLLWEIILPSALPSILVGVRYALGIMWLTLIVAETIAADSGIGYLAMNAREFMQTDIIVFSILMYAVLGKLADSIARWLEFRLLCWHPGYQK